MCKRASHSWGSFSGNIWTHLGSEEWWVARSGSSVAGYLLETSFVLEKTRRWESLYLTHFCDFFMTYLLFDWLTAVLGFEVRALHLLGRHSTT
jgi:hypothetical protein